MQIKNTSERYGMVSQLLHWLIAGLVAFQFVLASIFEDLPLGAEKIETVLTHKSVGMLILLLIGLRVFWRWINPIPQAPLGQRKYEHRLAISVHVALYVLLIAIPLSGWLMSSLADYPVSFFGLFEFPYIAPVNKDQVHNVEEVHEILATLILVLVSLHILAALKHHFVQKDDILRRMLPRIRRRG